MGALEFQQLHKNTKSKVHDNSSFLIKLRIIGPTMDVQQLFRNLQKEAECPLCLETVNNPKTLPCLHSFCLEEGSCKRRSNVRFVRHLFKSPKATRSRTCPHLIISTDWWMFWLLKIAAHRPRNVAVVMKTTPLPLTVSCARTFYALLVLKLTNA